jgi:hypothetical protein
MPALLENAPPFPLVGEGWGGGQPRREMMMTKICDCWPRKPEFGGGRG